MTSEFILIENEQISDNELESLLSDVYVGGKYTDIRDAEILLKASSVRKRGLLLGLRHRESEDLAGVIILVPPGSDAIKLAQANEAEVQLLGVSDCFRRKGIGRKLVNEVISRAKMNDNAALVLWTQTSMSAAQELYKSSGFQQTGSFAKNGKEFQVYRLVLA